MINLNEIGFNTICPICGKELDRIELITNGREIKSPYQTLKGYCPTCDYDFTMNEGTYKKPVMDILVKWNKVFKKNTKFITVDGIKAIVDKHKASDIDQIEIYEDEEMTVEAEKYCKDLGIEIVKRHKEHD